MDYKHINVGVKFPVHKIVTAMASVAKDPKFIEPLREFQSELDVNEPIYNMVETTIALINNFNVVDLIQRINRSVNKPTASVEEGYFICDSDDDVVEDIYSDYLGYVLDTLFYDEMVENTNSMINGVYYITIDEVRMDDMDNVYFMLTVGTMTNG